MDSIVAMGADTSKYVGRVQHIPEAMQRRYGSFFDNLQYQSEQINQRFLGALVRQQQITSEEAMRFFVHHQNDVLREAGIVSYGMEVKGPLVADAQAKVAALTDVAVMRDELRQVFDKLIADLTPDEKQFFLWEVKGV